MRFTLCLMSFLSAILVITSYSCNDKKRNALPSANDEKLAQQISKSRNFNEQQKLLRQIIQEYRKDTTTRKAPKTNMSADQLKHLKENPYYTTKEKEDSIFKMKSGRQKITITPKLRELMMESAELSRKINQDFPQLKSMAPDRKKSIILRAMMIEEEIFKN